MCDVCGARGVQIAFAVHDYKPLFWQCIKCENRWHLNPKSDYLWHVAEPMVQRGKERACASS
jgi:hypothetical protein